MERRTAAETIIRNHVLWAMGAGLIPVAVADVFAVTSLQLDMIRQLCRTYEVEFDEVKGKAIVVTLSSSSIIRFGGEELLKMIPGIGSVLGGAAMAVVSGASTWAIGQVFKKHFEAGGDLLDFDTEKMRHLFSEMFEKGKTIAQNLGKRVDAPEKKDKLQQISELIDMKTAGHLTEAEFDILKKKLIEQ